MSLRLIIEDDEGATTIVPLGGDSITIGRQQGNTIQLTEKNVSRRHARLFPDGTELWVIEDLNSYNGIKVNDKAVDGRTKLREGDIVQIGDYHLAITEDVDKRTLNYDRQGVVANDNQGEPLMASSSADLPRLTPEEIHALQSGPQPITPPPSPVLVDSGPVPATQYPAGYHEPERKRGAGLFIGLALLLIGGVGLGLFFYMQGGSDSGDDKSAAAPGKAKGGTPASAGKSPTPAGGNASAGETPPPAAPAADGGAVPPEVPDPTPVPTPPPEVPDPTPVPTPPPEATDPPPGPDDEVVIDDEPPTPTPTTSPRTTKPKKQPTKKKDPTPKPPAAPAGPSAAELLADARKKVYGTPTEAYQLAKQAYQKKRSQDALFVMGNAACRAGNVGNAKKAYNKLKGSKKAQIQKICGDKGITL